jgi:hypothetical protein
MQNAVEKPGFLKKSGFFPLLSGRNVVPLI